MEESRGDRSPFLTDEEGTRWYRSGDLAMYDEAHCVYRIVGRLKELIITGGFNVYPREIEDRIDQFPAVKAERSRRPAGPRARRAAGRLRGSA